MKIPAYWSKATAEETDEEGTKKSFSCWRWSDISQEAAHASALDTAKRILQTFLRGDERNRYGYGEAALREEVLQKFTNSKGELIAAVTQNHYGSLVLSTARVMFIDLDFRPVNAGQHLRNRMQRLFNKNVQTLDLQQESEARKQLDSFFKDNSHWGARIYRTRAGLRVIATHSLFEPAADSTQALLESLGTDPMYMRLCKAQDSFRARLTPKPWRCGHTSNTISWPRDDADQQERFEKWNSKYIERQSGFATCRFLAEFGNSVVHPDIKMIIEVHDRTTRCDEALDLA